MQHVKIGLIITEDLLEEIRLSQQVARDPEIGGGQRDATRAPTWTIEPAPSRLAAPITAP